MNKLFNKNLHTEHKAHALIRLVLSFVALIFSIAPAVSFEWPLDQNVPSDAFYSYFGQLRGDTISTSVVFSDPCKVKAWDDGFVTAIISEYDDDSIFFPSTLGNAVIISHNTNGDRLLTTYANIERESLDSLNLSGVVKSGTFIGDSGNSAWQDGKSSLEFQIIDSAHNTAVNPRTLMAHLGREAEVRPASLVLQNRNGRNYKISESDVLSAGVYRVYQKRPTRGMPYRTSIFVNGTIMDELSFNKASQIDGRVCISGKKNNDKVAMYPSPDLMLLGEVTITTGKNTLRATLLDMMGKEFSINYNTTNY